MLRVGDVDFERGVIRVSRSLSPGKHGELVQQSPKRHSGQRAETTRGGGSARRYGPRRAGPQRGGATGGL